VKCRTRSPDQSYIVSRKKCMALKSAGYRAVLQLYFRQEPSQCMEFRWISVGNVGWPHVMINKWTCLMAEKLQIDRVVTANVLVHCLAGRQTHLHDAFLEAKRCWYVVSAPTGTSYRCVQLQKAPHPQHCCRSLAVVPLSAATFLGNRLSLTGCWF